MGDSKLVIQCLCGQWLFKWSGYKARVASTLDSWFCSAQSLGILPCNDAAHYFHHTHRENNGAADAVASRGHEGMQSECFLEEVGRYYVLCFDGSVRNKCAAAGWILKTCQRPGAPLDEWKTLAWACAPVPGESVTAAELEAAVGGLCFLQAYLRHKAGLQDAQCLFNFLQSWAPQQHYNR